MINTPLFFIHFAQTAPHLHICISSITQKDAQQYTAHAGALLFTVSIAVALSKFPLIMACKHGLISAGTDSEKAPLRLLRQLC